MNRVDARVAGDTRRWRDATWGSGTGQVDRAIAAPARSAQPCSDDAPENTMTMPPGIRALPEALMRKTGLHPDRAVPLTPRRASCRRTMAPRHGRTRIVDMANQNQQNQNQQGQQNQQNQQDQNRQGQQQQQQNQPNRQNQNDQDQNRQQNQQGQQQERQGQQNQQDRQQR
jgi:Ca-activated chloride channel family protein